MEECGFYVAGRRARPERCGDIANGLAHEIGASGGCSETNETSVYSLTIVGTARAQPEALVSGQRVLPGI